MSLTSSAGSSFRRKSRIIVSDRSANTSSGPDRRITGAGRISFQVSTGITRRPAAAEPPVRPGPDLARVPTTNPPIAGASLCGTTDRTRLSGHRRCTLTPQPQPGGCRGQKRQAHGIGAYHSSFGARKQIEQSRRRVPVRVVCTHTNESHGSPKLEVEFGALVARSVMRNLDDVHRPNPAEGTHSLLGGSAQITEKNCSVRDILHVDDNAGVIAGRDIRNRPQHPPGDRTEGATETCTHLGERRTARDERIEGSTRSHAIARTAQYLLDPPHLAERRPARAERIECSPRSHAIERPVQYLVDPAAHRWHPTHVVEIPVGEHEQRHAFNPQFSPTPLQLGWVGAGGNECHQSAPPHKHPISLTDIAQGNRPLSRASRRSDARGTDGDPERHRSAHRDCGPDNKPQSAPPRTPPQQPTSTTQQARQQQCTRDTR